MKRKPKKAAPRLRLVFRPREDEVVYQPIEENMTGGGIIVAGQNQRENGTPAIIVAVSDGYRAGDGTLVPIDLKKGDYVMIRPNRGTRFRVPGQAGKDMFWFCSCHDVVIVFEEREVDADGNPLDVALDKVPRARKLPPS